MCDYVRLKPDGRRRIRVATQVRRGEDQAGRAVANGERDDVGLDCATIADGVSAYGGQLFEKVSANSTIAGTDTFYERCRSDPTVASRAGADRLLRTEPQVCFSLKEVS